MRDQQTMQQAKRQRNLGAGDAALENLSAAFWADDSGNQKIRGIIASAVSQSAGNWEITLTQDLPISEYLAGFMALVPVGVIAQIIDGTNTIKFLEVQFAATGTPVDISGIVFWLARAFSN